MFRKDVEWLVVCKSLCVVVFFLHSVITVTVTSLSTCKAIKERCQRMAEREEPSHGIVLKFKYPDVKM